MLKNLNKRQLEMISDALSCFYSNLGDWNAEVIFRDDKTTNTYSEKEVEETRKVVEKCLYLKVK